MSDKQLLSAIRNKSARIGILGMGYVGLPLVRTFCRAGFSCLGFDIDLQKVRALNAGRSYIKHIPSSLIRDLLATRRFKASDKSKDLTSCDALIMCVPTPLNEMREPDMTYVRATTETIAAILRKDQLVVLESTTYPGTTREVLKPILEATGLEVEKDFFLAYSPEREDPGRKDHTTETIPKVVGGFGPRSR